jgi:hypothetical protein
LHKTHRIFVILVFFRKKRKEKKRKEKKRQKKKRQKKKRQKKKKELACCFERSKQECFKKNPREERKRA